MRKIKKIGKKIKSIIIIICASAMILSGCGNRMFNKAVEQGKLAVAGMEYEKAKASFELALEEKEDDEVKAMLEQVEDMLAGLKAKENEDIEGAIKYLGRVTKEDSAFPTMGEQAKQIGQELQKVQDKISHYEQQIVEVESMLKEKKYAEGKEILVQLIEEIKDQKELVAPNQRAQDVLEKIHKEVSQMEAQRKEEKRKLEEEAAKQAEIEKQKRMISNAKLIDILVQGSDRVDHLIIRSTDHNRMVELDMGTYATYAPYNSEFNSYTKMENYLNPYFSRNSINKTLGQYIIERNGVMYGPVGDGVFNYYYDAKVIERTENENIIRIKVQYNHLAELSVSNFTYVYENDKWVINDLLEVSGG